MGPLALYDIVMRAKTLAQSSRQEKHRRRQLHHHQLSGDNNSIITYEDCVTGDLWVVVVIDNSREEGQADIGNIDAEVQRSMWNYNLSSLGRFAAAHKKSQRSWLKPFLHGLQ